MAHADRMPCAPTSPAKRVCLQVLSGSTVDWVSAAWFLGSVCFGCDLSCACTQRVDGTHLFEE